MSCLAVSLCLILFILMFSCHEFHKQLEYTPLVQKIDEGINEYLNYLNSRPATYLSWSIPQHLYWIEITLTQGNHQFLGNSYIS